MSVSYRIQYGEDVPDSFAAKPGRYGTVAAVLVIIGIMAVGGFLLNQQVREAVFPWTREFVQTAFAEFSAEMRKGECFRDAFGGFCREILDEANKVT